MRNITGRKTNTIVGMQTLDPQHQVCEKDSDETEVEHVPQLCPFQYCINVRHKSAGENGTDIRDVN